MFACLRRWLIEGAVIFLNWIMHDSNFVLAQVS
jgi:hypothetical protein